MRHHLFVVTLTALGALVSLVRPTAAEERQDGPVYLGVAVAPAAEGGAGVVVREVTTGAPADTAGIKPGDRVLRVGNQEVKDVEGFLRTVAAHKPGDKLAFVVDRGGKEQTLTATLGERRGSTVTGRPGLPASPDGRAPAFLGVNIEPLTPELRTQLRVDAESGAVVAEVVPNSPAEKAGLRRGDVITAVAERPVRTPEELREAVQQAGPGKEITLAVARGNEKLNVKATPQPGSVGYFLTPGDQRFPSVDVGSMFDHRGRVRELEKRVADLEKKVQELERKQAPPK